MSKKTVQTIVESGNDYVIQIKANQRTLYTQAQEVCQEQQPIDEFKCSEKGHGRHSHWHVQLFDASTCSKAKEWKGLKRFIRVSKQTLYTSPPKNRNRRKRKKQTDGIEARYYIASQSYESAEKCHLGIRAHWHIENKLHWVKDVLHNEDNNRIKQDNGAINYSIISTIALNIHRKQGHQSISYGQIKFCLNFQKLFQILLIQ